MRREVIIVIGGTGSGKTTWVRNYLRGLSRVLVFDAGFGEFYDEEQNLDTLARKLEAQSGGLNGTGAFRLAYTPRVVEYPAMFDLARIVGGLHLVIEEADRLDDPRSFEEYDDLISRGRHYGHSGRGQGVSIIAISLYAAKIPVALRSVCDTAIIFRQNEPNHVAYIADWIGDDAADVITALGRYEYVEWKRGVWRIVGANGKEKARGSSGRDIHEAAGSIPRGPSDDDVTPEEPTRLENSPSDAGMDDGQ